ncbi:MAG: polysaccharide export outer membrane protein [Gammaproteobacteria bacterium]|jgi:polysaccharide export outer membrane protein
MKRFLLLTSCTAFLAGCDLIPRGAGLQSEVLAATRDENGQPQMSFAVEVVTRDNLATFIRWPAPDDNHYNWIARVDQPNTRSITSGDTLHITIWSTEENGLLTAPGQRFVTLPDMRVSAAGTVFLPYVDTIRLRGMSPQRAREVIEERYATVSPSAQVQIELIEGRERTVSLISGVASPGSYPLSDNDVTILQLIADGGGISAALNNPQVRLQRNDRIYGISADRLLDSPPNDTTLQGGDKIYIEDDGRTFLSLGAAGSEAVHPFPSESVSALEALSIIGGISEDRADATGILILRRYPVASVTADRNGPDHPRTVFTLDLTSADGLFSADQFLIEPDDLVYVSESPLTAASSIMTVLGTVIGLSN